MPEKVEVPSGWPFVTGDYEVGDPQSCVALSSTGSHFKLADFPGVAIVGSDKTENIGIEKIIANIISNPNIRFLIVAGAEVPGHISGGSLVALWKNGIDPSTKKIIGTKGAIPFIENLPAEAVERFRKQVEVIDMIGVEDPATINAKIEELKARDPGAYPEEPMIVKLGGEEEAAAVALEVPLAMPAEPYMGIISDATESIRYKAQLIARDHKLTSGISKNAIIGTVAGLIFAALVSLPFLLWG